MSFDAPPAPSFAAAGELKTVADFHFVDSDWRFSLREDGGQVVMKISSASHPRRKPLEIFRGSPKQLLQFGQAMTTSAFMFKRK